MKNWLLMLAFAPAFAGAHDIWIETTTNVVHPGDWLGLSLMLGNHGNEHRDFKLASKVAAGDQRLFLLDPTGTRIDLSPKLEDRGFTAPEGFWWTRFTPPTPGLYTAFSTFDKIMSYGPVRDVKCAKSFFVAGSASDPIAGYDHPVGASFELVPLTNPVNLSAGGSFKVKLLFRGKPMAGVKVGFVPRGAVAKDDFDSRYEGKTAADGTVSLKLTEGNEYLVSAHWMDSSAKGKGYDSIDYSATIWLSTH